VKRTGQLNQCQCHSTCPEPSLPGKAFCKSHMGKCPRISPLSGWEPSYKPKAWNKKYTIRETHNCFSYAMNVNDPRQIQKCKKTKNCNIPFHQPGNPSKFAPFKSSKPKTCPNMMIRLLGDNPNLQMTTFEAQCPKYTSKIALVVDQSDDYHFLRQDNNTFWSQKSGARPVTNLDASKHEIWNPQLCDLNYSRNEGVLNYDVFCGFLCVPRTKSLFMAASAGGSRRASPSSQAKPSRKNSTLKRS